MKTLLLLLVATTDLLVTAPFGAASSSDDALQRDWMFQAEGQPLRERALAELARAQELAKRHGLAAAELGELAALEERLRRESAAGEDLYLAVRAAKRRILFRNPAIDFTRVLCIDQPYPRNPRGKPWPNDKNPGQIARHENSHRNGMMAAPGAYLTLIGPAIWIEPKVADLPLPDPRAPGYGLTGIYRVESFTAGELLKPVKYHNLAPARMDALTAKYVTLRPRTALSWRSPLIGLAMSGKHHDVRVDALSLQRLIAWVDAFGPYRGLEEIRALPDPRFDGIEQLAIRPRLQTAPDIRRP